MKYALWIAQVLLALAFVSAGAMKLITPDETLTACYPFPALFIRFIGVCELLGAVGLILPGLLRIRQELTPLAAAGLAIIMAGAVATTLAIGGGASARCRWPWGCWRCSSPTVGHERCGARLKMAPRSAVLPAAS